jgi:hypothetical protein
MSRNMYDKMSTFVRLSGKQPRSFGAGLGWQFRSRQQPRQSPGFPRRPPHAFTFFPSIQKMVIEFEHHAHFIKNVYFSFVLVLVVQCDVLDLKVHAASQYVIMSLLYDNRKMSIKR